MALNRIMTKEGEVYFVDADTGRRVEVDSKYTNTKQNPINNRFKGLLGLGQFISVVGWVVLIFSIIFIIVGITSVSTRGTLWAIEIGGGIIGFLNSILFIAIGQIISCFVSIEYNTWETTDLLKRLPLKEDKQEQNNSINTNNS